MKLLKETVLASAYKNGKDMMVVRGPHGDEMGFPATAKVAAGYQVTFKTDIKTGQHYERTGGFSTQTALRLMDSSNAIMRG